MLIDFNKSPQFQKNKYDVCICGAGPAGISLALKLSAAGKQVALIEAGDLAYTEKSQSIYSVINIGLQGWFNLTRLRFFGGTSNHWSGRCRPFDESDFTRQPPNDIPGWPISYDDILPYLPEAMRILDLKTNFTAINKGLAGGKFIEDKFALSTPTRFNSKHINQIKNDNNIDLYINCNLKDIRLFENQKSVEKITTLSYTGQTAELFSTAFVLSMGGVENARMLLNSNSQLPFGIGNSGGFVGQCFMEHYNVLIGGFMYEDTERDDSLQYYTSDAYIQSTRVGKANLSFGILDTIKGYGRLGFVRKFFKTLSCDIGVADKVQYISNFKCPGTGTIGSLIEQFPNKNSKVTLSDDVDALGLQKAVINWEMSQDDKNSIRTIAKDLAKDFADSGQGVVKLEEYLLDDNADIPVSAHAHHMGTTRMSETPEHGVVDADCRVFGTNNLYIAGSSVFSTGGAANPTMPIIQLALRLAEHLKDKV